MDYSNGAVDVDRLGQVDLVLPRVLREVLLQHGVAVGPEETRKRGFKAQGADTNAVIQILLASELYK